MEIYLQFFLFYHKKEEIIDHEGKIKNGINVYPVQDVLRI